MSEYRVKAAYLYNFAKFVEWPAAAFSGPKDPIVFAVVGDDPFGKELEDALRGKVFGERPVAIRRFKEIKEISGCHLLFVSSSLEANLRDVLEKTRGLPIVTVGECRDFAKRGGIFGFVLKDRKVRIEVNTDAAKRAGITVSAKLLQLATIVNDERLPE